MTSSLIFASIETAVLKTFLRSQIWPKAMKVICLCVLQVISWHKLRNSCSFFLFPIQIKWFSPKFMPDQPFGYQCLHPPTAANHNSCLEKKQKQKQKTHITIFCYEYQQNNVDTHKNYVHHTHFFIFPCTIMRRTARTFLSAALMCWVKHDKTAKWWVEWGRAKCSKQDVTVAPFSWTWLLSGRTGTCIDLILILMVESILLICGQRAT